METALELDLMSPISSHQSRKKKKREMGTDHLFHCPRCPPEVKKLRNLDTLREHIARVHFEFRLYSCPKCQCGFVTPHLALTHIRKICKIEGAIPMSSFSQNLLAQDLSFLLELQNAEKEAISNFINDMARKLVKKPLEPPRPPEKFEVDIQTELGMTDFITRDDFLANNAALMANNAALLQQYAYNQHIQCIQQPPVAPTYFEPTPQMEYEPPPAPPRGPRTPIGPRTPPEESFEESPASPLLQAAGVGYQPPIQHDLLQAIQVNVYETCSSTDTGAEVPSDLPENEKLAMKSSPKEEENPHPGPSFTSGFVPAPEQEIVPLSLPLTKPILMTLKKEPCPETYHIQGFGDMDVDEDDAHTADEDSSSRKDSESDDGGFKRNQDWKEDRDPRKRRRNESYQRNETELHVCEYRGCCDPKSRYICQFCEGLHQNVDCATVTDLSDRKLILRMKDFCYRCGGDHRREGTVQCNDVSCFICGLKSHMASVCGIKRHQDILRDLKATYRMNRLSSTSRSRKLRKDWELKVDEIARSLRGRPRSREGRPAFGSRRGSYKDGVSPR